MVKEIHIFHFTSDFLKIIIKIIIFTLKGKWIGQWRQITVCFCFCFVLGFSPSFFSYYFLKLNE